MLSFTQGFLVLKSSSQEKKQNQPNYQHSLPLPPSQTAYLPAAGEVFISSFSQILILNLEDFCQDLDLNCHPEAKVLRGVFRGRAFGRWLYDGVLCPSMYYPLISWCALRQALVGDGHSGCNLEGCTLAPGSSFLSDSWLPWSEHLPSATQGLPWNQVTMDWNC